MSKAILRIKKSSAFALRLHYDILLQKGGALPPGSIRVWGGKEYIKVAPGKWRLKLAGFRNKELTDTEKKLFEYFCRGSR
jgi:hypothetical protein